MSVTRREPTRQELQEMEDELQRKSRFSCSKCGQQFPTIEAVYEHLDSGVHNDAA